MAIDPTARVADGARLGENVEIGPFCIVGAQVELKSGVRLISHVSVTGVTTIGEGTVVYPFASLGTPPQSTHYRGGATRLNIGAHCQIRENVTINTGTEAGGGLTRVGDHCFLMVGSHIGHDCDVGNAVTFANLVTLGGHVQIGDNVFVGGLAAVHQHGRVGEGAMVGGTTAVRSDVIPFAMVWDDHLKGLNIVGLRRRGATRSDLHHLRGAYRKLFHAPGVFAEKVEAVAQEFAGDPTVEKIISFIRADAKRALMHPAMTSLDNGDHAPA
jgi:UDP-N-acetylglucosamine acyltransferase